MFVSSVFVLVSQCVCDMRKDRLQYVLAPVIARAVAAFTQKELSQTHG